MMTRIAANFSRVRFPVAVLLAALVSLAAHAQMLMLGAGSSGVVYQGPGDIQSGAVAWYGLRAYSHAAANAGTSALTVRRASDSSTDTIAVLVNGALNVNAAIVFAGTDATCAGTIAGTVLTVSSCGSGTIRKNDPISGAGIVAPAFITTFGTGTGGAGTYNLNQSQTVTFSETITFSVPLYVTSWNDQTGNGHTLAQATTTAQPLFLPYCTPNNGPCLAFGTGVQVAHLDNGSFPTEAQPFTEVFAGQTYSGQSAGTFATSSTTTDGVDNTTQAYIYAGTSKAYSFSQGAWHAEQSLFAGSSSESYLDGTTTALNSPGTNSLTSSLKVGDDAGSDVLNGLMLEVGIWDSNISGTFGTMNTNMHTFWGF